MATSITPDLAGSLLVVGALGTAAVAFVLATRTLRARGEEPRFERLEQVRALPLVGKAPMDIVYSATLPIGRGLASLGISANAITIASGVIAILAAYFFATGHFGLGTFTACVSALADALDGIVARATGTAGKFGQVLDTTVDRFVEALFVGSVAFLVREDAVLLVIALLALVGGFMVSYASSVLRELGASDARAPMRRAHRLAYFLIATSVVPVVQLALPNASLRVQLAPLFVALAAIGVIGNITAVQRLLRGAREAAAREPAKPAEPMAVSRPIANAIAKQETAR